MKYNLTVEGSHYNEENKHYDIIFSEFIDSEDYDTGLFDLEGTFEDKIIKNMISNGYFKYFSCGVPHYIPINHITCIYFSKVE